ncbi:hypothetical protein WG906_01175 [Pedobacter sp. P351]
MKWPFEADSSLFVPGISAREVLVLKKLQHSMSAPPGTDKLKVLF